MTSQRALMRPIIGASVLVVLGVCFIWALANLVLVTAQWEFDDVHAYVRAAQRLADGAPLYITTPDVSDMYFYAPWFALIWVPFAGLATPAVEVVWAVILVLATLAALLPFRRSLAGIALILLLGGLLYRTAGWGNVQPLVVAMLVYALPTRAGPWAVGLASSLKPWPLLAVGLYAWRRDWRAVAISLGVTAALWGMVLLFNWRDYPLGSRPPNIYDATFLLAVPALLGAQGPRAGTRSRTRAAAAG